MKTNQNQFAIAPGLGAFFLAFSEKIRIIMG